MDQKETLQWCVDNLTQWPSVDGNLFSPSGCRWCPIKTLNGDRLVLAYGCLDGGEFVDEMHWKLRMHIDGREIKKDTPIPRQSYMPAVGEECEYYYCGVWRREFYFGKSPTGKHILIDDSDNVELLGGLIEFRPPPTEEEVERENKINEIAAKLESNRILRREDSIAAAAFFVDKILPTTGE